MRTNQKCNITGFLSIDDLASGQEELAISVKYDSVTDNLCIAACAPLPQNTKPADIAAAYLSLCDTDGPQLFNLSHTHDLENPEQCMKACTYTILNARMPLAVYMGKKYKPVALKIRPVETELPSQFRITRNIKNDPLKELPKLPTKPPAFTPTGRYTEEHKV